ncbi:MAG TPA: Gfo/Idh/MocA family oxidoreductase [Gemmatimonadales bacterium]|jgi:predicted dehydrogenase|nr:Gfo/Idh/MocA family oxidoreductase [Gemmatimonadales bacterium]
MSRTVDGAAAPAVAVVGCGAIASTQHVPALAEHPEVRERLVLVDQDLDRARGLADAFGVASVAADYRDILGSVDGVVIALPHHLHFRVVLDCLRAGAHVLCEKPLAESAAEVAELAAAAEQSHLTLAVNNTRRLFPPSKRVHELLSEGAIGPVRFLGYYDGAKYNWPSASGFAFGLRGTGKGVLLDVGAHVLDLVCWWLGRQPQITDYADDSLGGSEAVAKLSFTDGGTHGEVHLSWLAKLQNGFRVEGEAGSIVGSVYDWHAVELVSRSGKRKRIPLNSGIRTSSDLGRLVVKNFLDVIQSGRPPLVSARDIAPSIAMIEECYARRRRFDMPWHDHGKQILHAL